MQLRKRYPLLYIPSDFSDVSIEWPQTTPIENPISISASPVIYHVLHRDVHCPSENSQVLNPPDADYRYSAKVRVSTNLLSNVTAQYFQSIQFHDFFFMELNFLTSIQFLISTFKLLVVFCR